MRRMLITVHATDLMSNDQTIYDNLYVLIFYSLCSNSHWSSVQKQVVYFYWVCQFTVDVNLVHRIYELKSIGLFKSCSNSCLYNKNNELQLFIQLFFKSWNPKPSLLGKIWPSTASRGGSVRRQINRRKTVKKMKLKRESI